MLWPSKLQCCCFLHSDARTHVSIFLSIVSQQIFPNQKHVSVIFYEFSVKNIYIFPPSTFLLFWMFFIIFPVVVILFIPSFLPMFWILSLPIFHLFSQTKNLYVLFFLLYFSKIFLFGYFLFFFPHFYVFVVVVLIRHITISPPFAPFSIFISRVLHSFFANQKLFHIIFYASFYKNIRFYFHSFIFVFSLFYFPISEYFPLY